MNILIVDDDPVLQELLCSFFASRGHCVRRASNGVEALAMVETALKLDVVLLDVLMPGLSGNQFIKAVRGGGDTIPIVVLSGYRNELEAHLVDQVDAVVDKPPSMDNLLKVVESAVSRSASP